MRTRIKICGIKTIEAGLTAAHAGADAIGFMFYAKSKRVVTIQQAKEITLALPPFINKVGVFVNPTKAMVRVILEQIPLDYLQFHGTETDAFCKDFPVPYIKAVCVKKNQNMQNLETQFPAAKALLLDTYVSGKYGGTGVSFDWKLANYSGTKPVILAGGLSVDNVQKAIQDSMPYAVDVSSGVETQGNKDLEKIQEFCRRAQAS